MIDDEPVVTLGPALAGPAADVPAFCVNSCGRPATVEVTVGLYAPEHARTLARYGHDTEDGVVVDVELMCAVCADGLPAAPASPREDGS